MESSTLIILVSSLLFISSIIAIVIYVVMTQQKEETTTPEEEIVVETPQAFIEFTTAAPTTAEPTTTVGPITPPPTTAAPYAIGQSIMCTSNDVGGGLNAIYRYVGDNTLRIYPNAETAKSWDPDYLNSKKIDCQDLKKGSDMTMGSFGQTQAPSANGVSAPQETTPDPDYVNVKQVVNTNYRNIPDSCYTEAGGVCNELKFDDCYATMKSNGDFVIRKDADTAPTLVWNTNTQYVGDGAKFTLGDDGRFHVVANDTFYWGSSNSDNTNGPFVAHLEKSNGKCRLSIYDKDNANIYSTS